MVTLGGGGSGQRRGVVGTLYGWGGGGMGGRDGGEGDGMFKGKAMSLCRSSFRLILNVVGLS